MTHSTHEFLLQPESQVGSGRYTIAAEVQPMSEGDLIIGLRHNSDQRPEKEFAILSIRPEDDGTVSVTFLDGDGGSLGIEDVKLGEADIGGAAGRLARFVESGDTGVLTEGLDE